jgi:hypothetical protein
MQVAGCWTYVRYALAARRLAPSAAVGSSSLPWSQESRLDEEIFLASRELTSASGIVRDRPWCYITPTPSSACISSLVLPVLEIQDFAVLRLNAQRLARKVYALAGLESRTKSSLLSLSGRFVSAACTRSSTNQDAKAGVAALRPASKRLHLPIRAGLDAIFAETRYGFGVLARRSFMLSAPCGRCAVAGQAAELPPLSLAF